MHEVSRRTVVRAGVGAAWTVPVVSIATAAPAMANSPGVSATITSAQYLGQGSEDFRPDVLLVSAQFDVGARQVSRVTVAVIVPLWDPLAPFPVDEGSFGSVVAATDDGSGFSVTDPGTLQTDGTWLAAFVPDAGSLTGTTGFSARLDLGSKTGPPFPGWRGAPLSPVTVTLSTGAGSAVAVSAVEALPRSSLSPALVTQAKLREGTLTLSASDIFVVGRCGIGKLYLDISIPRSSPYDAWLGLDGASMEAGLDWDWAVSAPADVEDEAWVLHFETWQWGYAGSLREEFSDRGPGDFSVSLPVTEDAPPSITPQWVFRADGLQP